METSEHQEWRSRQEFNPAAAAKAAFGTGLIFYYMSGGSPWSTAGTMNMIMGRDIPGNFWVIMLGHFAVTFIYTFLIGLAIYRLPTVFAVPAGVGVGLALYAFNVLIFHSSGLTMLTIEFVPFFVHVVFSLFVSLIYKALSVPPPLPGQP